MPTLVVEKPVPFEESVVVMLGVVADQPSDSLHGYAMARFSVSVLLALIAGSELRNNHDNIAAAVQAAASRLHYRGPATAPAVANIERERQRHIGQ